MGCAACGCSGMAVEVKTDTGAQPQVCWLSCFGVFFTYVRVTFCRIVEKQQFAIIYFFKYPEQMGGETSSCMERKGGP